MASDSFHVSNFNAPSLPVVLSVPHAGRAHDPALLALLRVPVSAVLPLEDRYADLLTDTAVECGVPTIIARTPRLMIDLNRAPGDIDPDSVRGGLAPGTPVSAKARAGLGLIPTRLWGVGPLWKRPFDAEDIVERLREIHTPYHSTIAAALQWAKGQWGAALLIDVHSMPPVKGDDGPDIVIGDRFGASAGGQITATAEATLTGLGFRVAINAPYAGGYLVSRHARPLANIHALQVEVDRQLYLDAALDQPGPGLARMQRALVALVESLTDELTGEYTAAAE
jgi:N-formylglutamate amidohydrolase